MCEREGLSDGWALDREGGDNVGESSRSGVLGTDEGVARAPPRIRLLLTAFGHWRLGGLTGGDSPMITMSSLLSSTTGEGRRFFFSDLG